MSAFESLVAGIVEGRKWSQVGQGEPVKDLLWRVYDERYSSHQHFKNRFQVRVNLQAKSDAASYAGWISAENPTSGPYQGMSLVWFPGEGGSVVVLVVGTDGIGQDTQILGRPGHGRRLRALSRLHQGRLWVKPDLLDLVTRVPEAVSRDWPEITAALRSYDCVTYAAVAVRREDDAEIVADLLDLFFHEHRIPLVGKIKARWEKRLEDIAGAIFPVVTTDEIYSLLGERRFVILEGPPGTGKTRCALEVAHRVGSPTILQFHAARTYEDFVVGLFPKPAAGGLAFEVRPGDLLAANQKAKTGKHVLVIDEINRADLARVLGEAVLLFEVGEAGRSVRLPYVPDGFTEDFELSPDLLVLGTRNTADRSVARMDIAIRRRFAFQSMWPDLEAVRGERVEFAQEFFADTIHTFTEFADDETLRLVPGHAYFLDPRPDLKPEDRPDRVARRIQRELLPLIREYLADQLLGNASEAVAGLRDRIETTLLGRK